jgi:hypothetical protein
MSATTSAASQVTVTPRASASQRALSIATGEKVRQLGAGRREGGEDRAQPEALVVGVRDRRQCRPAVGDVAQKRHRGGDVDHQDPAATGLAALGALANSR